MKNFVEEIQIIQKIDVQKCNKNAKGGHFQKIFIKYLGVFIPKNMVLFGYQSGVFLVFCSSPMVFSALDDLATLARKIKRILFPKISIAAITFSSFELIVRTAVSRKNQKVQAF